MNYLAHAYQHLADPHFAAGTALPDWLSVIDRKNRARRQYAEPLTCHGDPRIASFARGCIQHHDDDFWFHQNEPFVRLSTTFAVELRLLLDAGMGHQAGFVGHIAVELMLDAVLVERSPSLLDEYYTLLAELDPEFIQSAANEICRRPVTRLVELLPKFVEARFIAQYSSDVLLLRSFNGIMKRIALPQLPETVVGWIPSARERVRDVADELLRPSLRPVSGGF